MKLIPPNFDVSKNKVVGLLVFIGAGIFLFILTLGFLSVISVICLGAIERFTKLHIGTDICRLLVVVAIIGAVILTIFNFPRTREAQQNLLWFGVALGVIAITAVFIPTYDKSNITSSITEFAWPPPVASVTTAIALNSLSTSSYDTVTFGMIGDELQNELASSGYGQIAYYKIPRGFALATQIEQLNESGIPLIGAKRWEITLKPLAKFNLNEYIAALFHVRSGYFRVIVFVITPQAFVEKQIVTTRDEGSSWVSNGANRLPSVLYNLPCPQGTTCTALLYEFECSNELVKLNVPGKLIGDINIQQELNFTK